MSSVSDEVVRERSRREGEESTKEERIHGLEEDRRKERKERELGERRQEKRIEKMELKEKEREKSMKETREIMASFEKQVRKERTEMALEIGSMKERLQRLERRGKEREKMEADLKEHAIRIEEMERSMTEKAFLSQKIVEAKESEKEMEKKVGAAMEQIKILDLDFEKVIESKEEIVKVAVELIQENVKICDRKDWDWSMRRSRVYILGKATKEKEYEGRKIFTVPILISCPCIGDKERLERIIRNAGIRVSFHWPTEMLEYVKGIRDRMEGMGCGGREEFVRVRAVREEGDLFIRVDVRKKKGGRFRWIGDWKCPPLNKELWGLAEDILRPYCRSADVVSMN